MERERRIRLNIYKNQKEEYKRNIMVGLNETQKQELEFMKRKSVEETKRAKVEEKNLKEMAEYNMYKWFEIQEKFFKMFKREWAFGDKTDKSHTGMIDVMKIYHNKCNELNYETMDWSKFTFDAELLKKIDNWMNFWDGVFRKNGV
jgi:hypothetical protein